MITMLGTWVLGLCGLHIPGLFSAGPLGIGVGLVSAGLAASNLVSGYGGTCTTTHRFIHHHFQEPKGTGPGEATLSSNSRRMKRMTWC